MVSKLGEQLDGISLTKEGKKPLKEALFLTDLRKAIELEHHVRGAILEILRRGIPDKLTLMSTDPKTKSRIVERKQVSRDALSITEIVKMSKDHLDVIDLTRNQVNHHLPKMLDEEFVIRYGTLTTGKRETDYYRRIARVYVVTMETPNLGADFLRERESKRIKRIIKTANFSLSDDDVEELVETRIKIELLQDKWRTKIAKLLDNDVMEPDVTEMYHWLIDAYSVGSDEYLKLLQYFRKIMFQNLGDDE